MAYDYTQEMLSAPAGMNSTPQGAMSPYAGPATTASPMPTLKWPTETSFPAPATAAPAPAPTPTPTIGQTLEGIKAEALRVQDVLNSRNTSNFSTSGYEGEPAYTPFDDKAARREATRNQMKLFQSEINATNKVYDNMLENARVQGLGRLGSQRAMSARSGTLGSDFGAANADNVVSLNNREQAAIGEQRTAAIGRIMGNVRDAAFKEVEAKRLARSQGAKEYLDYLSRKSERKTQYTSQVVNDMLDQGYDIAQFTPQELDEFGREAGLTSKDLIAAYTREKRNRDAATAEAGLKTRKTEAEIAKIDADIAKGKLITIGEGTMLYNTETGETFKNPKTYAPNTSGGLGSFSSESVSSAAQALEETRGSDNYANTGVYLDLYEQAIANDVLPQDFIKKFPPDLYLNPEDPSIPAFIKNDMMEVDLFGSL